MSLPVNRGLFWILRLLRLPVAWDVSVGAVVFSNRTGTRKYLLLHYPSGHFDFAKGHVEPGETEEYTLRRETFEETGIDELRVFPYPVSIRYFYVAKGKEAERRRQEGRGIWIFKVVTFYPAECLQEEIKLSHEHIGSVWLPYREADTKVTFENAKKVLRETEDYLNREWSES